MPELISTPEQLLTTLIKNRHLKSKKDIDSFFSPEIEDDVSEFDLPNIAKAKKRILQAIKNQELIIIYGDYDVDGVCATALLYHSLVTLGAKVLPFIPHREKEGYGLSKNGINSFKEKNPGLVITVDNGIVAVESANYLKTLDIDLIITDHHIPNKKSPEALAIIHSTKFCGAAVAWCLARELVPEAQSKELLQFVALATICDLMPLVGVNRSLVCAGLIELHKTSRLGILALVNECELAIEDINSYHIGHILGPRLNAAGRLDSAMDSLRLLCTKDPEKAKVLAKKLAEDNDLKKQLTNKGLDQIKNIINSTNVSLQKVIIVSSDKWIPGIIGLLAGRICEEYKLPAIVISEGLELSKGSVRSIDGLDVVATLRQCSDLLIDIGGHPKAAGFSLQTKKIPEFKSRLESIISKMEINQLVVDQVEGNLDIKKVDLDWLKVIDKFEPFGIGNPKPIFSAFGVIDDMRTVGEGKHLKLKIDGIDAIAFGMGHRQPELILGSQINLNFFLELNEFNGSTKLQLKVLSLSV